MPMMVLKTRRDLRRHTAQFVGLVLVVALGLCTFVGFLTSYFDLKASIQTAEEKLHFADFSTKVLTVPLSSVDTIRRLPGVRAAEGRLVLDAALDLPDESNAKIRFVSLPDSGQPSVNSLLVENGRLPEAGARDEVALHTKFAIEAGTKVGDILTVRIGAESHTLRVVGIVASPEYLYAVAEKGELPSPREFAVVFMRRDAVEGLFGRAGSVNDVSVLVDSGDDPAEVARAVEAVLEHYGPAETVQRADQPSAFMLADELEQNRVMAVFLPLIILAISAASIFITLSRLVASQRGEIGLSKALGYTDGQVFGHYLLFSVAIAAGGAILGAVLGDVLARIVSQQYIDLLGVPYLVHRAYPSIVLGAFGVSLIACLAAGLYPAWRAVRIPPAEAMHADPNDALSGGKIPLAERLLGRLLPRSLLFRIPLRNVFRVPRRSLYTLVGIALALLITVATQTLFDSIDEAVRRVPAEAERWDLTAEFDEAFAEGRLAEVRRWQGVTSAEGARVVPVTLAKGAKTSQGAITVVDPAKASFHGFTIETGSSAEEALASGGLILPESLAEKIDARVGDVVTVSAAFRDSEVRLPVAAISREVLGTPVYVAFAPMREFLGEGSDRYNVMFVRTDGMADDVIEAELKELPGATTVASKAEMVSRFVEMLEFMKFYQWLLLVFGVAMAFVVVYNTFTTNVAERTREIATMRTIGESNGRLALMLTVENLLLTLVGIPIGVWLGIRTAEALIDSLSSEAYALEPVLSGTSTAAIVIGAVVVALLSEIQPVRRVFRMDLAQATKTME